MGLDIGATAWVVPETLSIEVLRDLEHVYRELVSVTLTFVHHHLYNILSSRLTSLLLLVSLNYEFNNL